MILTLSAAEAFAIKAAAARRRDLRSIAERITPEQIAAEKRAESKTGTEPQGLPAHCAACPHARPASAAPDCPHYFFNGCATPWHCQEAGKCLALRLAP